MRVSPLIVWLGLASAAVAGPDGPTQRLTVHWADPEGQFPYPLAAVAREARAVFEPLNVQVSCTRARATVPAGDVTVVLLAADRSGRLGERTMACAPHGRGGPQVAWVLVPRLKQVLELPLDVPLRDADVVLLGRALARVAAHEIVHLVAPELPHARSGLMSAALGRDFLVSPRARLDQALAEALGLAFDGRRLLSPGA